MQPQSSKNNYNGTQNMTINNITGQNRANQMVAGINNRQNISNLTPRNCYVPANTIFPAVHPNIAMGQFNASYAAARPPTLQQCQYAPQYYPHVYYPYYMPQIAAQQQQQQPQNNAGNPLTGLNTIMAVQPGGFVSGPVAAANRTTMPFTVNIANTNTAPPAAGLPALQQNAASLPFAMSSVVPNTVLSASSTTTVSQTIGVTSIQQSKTCLPFATTAVGASVQRIAQPRANATKQQKSLQTKGKLRSHALQIIDPITKKNILQEPNKDINRNSCAATDDGKAKTPGLPTQIGDRMPTASKSVEIMQNIENFSSKKKFKDATQQAEQKLIAATMTNNASVEISVIPNLTTSKSELLMTHRDMSMQITVQQLESNETEEEGKEKPITLNDESNKAKGTEIAKLTATEEENLLVTPITNKCSVENTEDNAREISISDKIKEPTEPLPSNCCSISATIDELNLNSELNAVEDTETENDSEGLSSQIDLENDDNDDALFAISSQADETNTQITFFNETFKTFNDYGEMQDTTLSPTNIKQYSRKQLMQLRQTKHSCMQPDVKNSCMFAPISLIATRAHKKMPGTTSSHRRSSTSASNAQSNVKQNAANNRNVATGVAAATPECTYQTGHNNRLPGKPLIYLNLSLNQDVKLNKADNAWRPRVLLKTSDTLDNNNLELHEKEEKEELLRRVRGILNKLTPEKFEPLVEEIIKLKIDNMEKMKAVMNLVFEKAIDEPSFSVSYAKLCHRLINEVKARDERMESSTKSNLAYFRNALLDKTESEFTNNVTKINAKEEKLKPIREKLANCQDVNEKIELEALLIEEERKIRRRSGGTVRFIGELFKISILSGKIINTCIEALLKEPRNEDMLECLCKLLTTVGQKFEQTLTYQDDRRKYSLKNVIQRMHNIASKTGNSKISSRVRFMLLDVIDLRKKKWQSTRNEAPKTMEQIEMEVNVSAPSSSYTSSTNKRDEQKRQQGGSQTVSSHQSNYAASQAHSILETSSKSTKLNTHTTEKCNERGRCGNSADNSYVQRNSTGGFNKYNLDGGGKITYESKWQVHGNKANSSRAVDTSKLVGLTTVDLNNKKMGGVSLFQWKKVYTPPAPSAAISQQQQQTSNSFAPLSLEANRDVKLEHDHDKMRSNTRQKMQFNKGRMEHERFTHESSRRHNQNATKGKAVTQHGQQTNRAQKSGHQGKYQQDITLVTRTPAKISLLQRASTSTGSEIVQSANTTIQPIVFMEPTEGHLKLMKSVITEMLENAADTKCIDNSTVSCITKLAENLRCSLIYYILTDYLHLANVKSLTRRQLSNVVSYLIENQYICDQHFHMAYTKFADLASELNVDIPQLWLYIFEFTGPLIVKKILTVNDLWNHQLRDSGLPDFGQKFLKSFIQYTTREVGPNFMRLVWKKFQMKWSDYMDKVLVEDFIKRNCFEYVENENSAIPYNYNEKESLEKCYERIADRIQQMLNEGTTSDQIIDLIHGNVKNIDKAFVQVLSTTLTNFAIKDSHNYSLDVNCLQRICIPVLRRYLDTKPDLELECLSAIQFVIHNLGHPKDLLQTIFFELSDADIIAQETFWSWQDVKKQCKKCSAANLKRKF